MPGAVGDQIWLFSKTRFEDFFDMTLSKELTLDALKPTEPLGVAP